MPMRLPIIALLTALSLLLVACGATDEPPPSLTPIPTSTPSPAPTPRPTATPLPTPTPTSTPAASNSPAKSAAAESPFDRDGVAVIAATIDAMRQVESFHAEVDAAFTVIQTEASFQMDEETFGAKFPIRFSGDFQLPDRAAGKLQLALGLALLEMDIVNIGDIAYITNPETAAWEQYPLFLTGLPDPYDLVLLPPETSRYSEIKIVKDEIIDGIETRHLKANLRANVLGGSYETLYLELWIGKDDNLLRRLTMAGKAEVEEEDTAGLAVGVLDIGGDAEFTMTITYTNYNAPITIQPPIP